MSKPLYVFLVVGLFFFSCHDQTINVPSDTKNSDPHQYKSIFGEQYSAVGNFYEKSKDSVENKLWYFTDLSSPLVLYGSYTDGLPTGQWTFVLRDGHGYTSIWSEYKNDAIGCVFSMPFSYEETDVDTSFIKLKTINDSLGKISILVGIIDTVIKKEDLINFGPNAEIGLRQQGYTFRSNREEIKKDGDIYFFDEYFINDSSNRNMKLYHTYGYTPSKKRFIELTLFHDGPKDDLVKIIYNLIVTSIYIRNERFFNPYLN